MISRGSDEYIKFMENFHEMSMRDSEVMGPLEEKLKEELEKSGFDDGKKLKILSSGWVYRFYLFYNEPDSVMKEVIKQGYKCMIGLVKRMKKTRSIMKRFTPNALNDTGPRAILADIDMYDKYMIMESNEILDLDDDDDCDQKT